jgi:large subunit ribosomal protein L14e
VEPGRVAFINFGEDYGRQVTIVDIADANRVLVDGENFPRTILPMKRLSLTKTVVPCGRGARTGTLVKATKKAGLSEAWTKTPFMKKLTQRTTRANLTDFERFQVMINRKKRSMAIRKKVKVISKKK